MVALIAKALNDAILSGNTDYAISTLASREAGSSMISMGKWQMNGFNPVGRSYRDSIALLPPCRFLCCLLSSPGWSGSENIVGFFVWITMSALLTQSYINYAMGQGATFFETYRDYPLGTGGDTDFSAATEKNLAKFGGFRFCVSCWRRSLPRSLACSGT
jgi:hypothetical protein